MGEAWEGIPADATYRSPEDPVGRWIWGGAVQFAGHGRPDVAMSEGKRKIGRNGGFPSSLPSFARLNLWKQDQPGSKILVALENFFKKTGVFLWFKAPFDSYGRIYIPR